MRRDYEHHFSRVPPLSRPAEIPPQPGCIAGRSYFAGMLLFLFALAVLIHVKPLEHVAFNILSLGYLFDVSDAVSRPLQGSASR